MKLSPFFTRNILMILFLLFFFFTNSSFGQTIEQLENEIEGYEQKITNLEKEITRNNTSNNSSANSSLESQIKSYEQEIGALVKQIKVIQSGGTVNKNDCELEIMSCRKEMEVLEEVIEKLENESLDLQKEIQRLTMQGGGSAEIEKLQKKVESQKREIQVLKQQIQGYRQNSNTSSSNSPKVQIIKLEGKIKELKNKNNYLQQQLNKSNSSVGSNGARHLFQKQFVLKNATSLVFGYKYSILPKLNFKETPKLYQSARDAGSFISVPNDQVLGHNGFWGVEFLWHGFDVGGNVGLTANYSYNMQENMIYHILGFQFSPELTILPLRIGLKPSAYFGYTWGKINNHNALLNNSSVQSSPEFSTMAWGWDVKLRVYISRFIAFTGSIGSDYPLSQDFDMEFWDTSLKFGVGIDFIIPVSIR
ncbi:hypothetical protein [Aureispira sp. CCB-QB1]|uniref:hypothetical protein n=1 Tax=Aureispira sp. CCB-QB1 TaxID=1313421 RepID=UPI0012DF6658|nr:hypothetical protein [Aureispira sp. CCB-QB1]